MGLLVQWLCKLLRPCRSDVGNFSLHCYHMQSDRLSRGDYVSANCRNRYNYAVYQRCCRCGKAAASPSYYVAV